MSFVEINDACHYARGCEAVNLDEIDQDFRRWLDIIVEEFLRNVSEINRSFCNFRGVNLQIGFFESPKFDACSFTFKGKDYILVSFTQIVWLRQLFVTIEYEGISPGDPASPTFFGHKPVETPIAIPPFKNPILAKEVSPYDEVRRGIRPKLKSPLQAGYPFHCLTTGMHAIFHHELGHLWNGHCDLLSADGKEILHESTFFNGYFNIVRYALEMDADCMAMRGLLLWHFRRFKIPCLSVPDKFDPKEMTDIERRVFFKTLISLPNLIFPLYITMRMSMVKSGFCQEKSLIKPKYHPPLFFRMRVQIDEIFTFFHFAPRFSRLIWDLSRFWLDTSEAIFSASTSEAKINIFSPEISREFNSIYTQAVKAWEALWPKLDPYKRGRELRRYQAGIE